MYFEKSVTSWSRNSRQILSASTDNTVSVWDVVTGNCERTFTFPCPVMKVQFNPRNANQILVCPLRHPPVLIDVLTGKPIILKQEEEVGNHFQNKHQVFSV